MRGAPAFAAASTSAHLEQRWNEERLATPVLQPAWRAWHYQGAVIVLGRSQRSLLDTIEPRHEMEVLRRASGGGAVLVGPWMLGLSVALPPDHRLVGDGAVNSYRWLGQAIARALLQSGIDAWAISPQALLARRAQNPAPALDWACFGALSPWEVLVGDKKIAGLAQVRRRQGILLVAGVLLKAVPWQLLTDGLGRLPQQANQLSELTTHCAACCPQLRADNIPARLMDFLGREIESALAVKPAALRQA